MRQGEARQSLASLSGSLIKDGVHKPGKPAVEFSTSQRVLMNGAGHARLDKARLAQYAKVVRHA